MSQSIREFYVLNRCCSNPFPHNLGWILEKYERKTWGIEKDSILHVQSTVTVSLLSSLQNTTKPSNPLSIEDQRVFIQLLPFSVTMASHWKQIQTKLNHIQPTFPQGGPSRQQSIIRSQPQTNLSHKAKVAKLLPLPA